MPDAVLQQVRAELERLDQGIAQHEGHVSLIQREITDTHRSVGELEADAKDSATRFEFFQVIYQCQATNYFVLQLWPCRVCESFDAMW